MIWNERESTSFREDRYRTRESKQNLNVNRSRDPLLSLSANRSTDHRHFTEAFRGGSSTFLLFLTFSFFVFRFHVYASFSNNLDQKGSRPSRDTAHNTLRKPRVRRFNEQRFLLYTEYTPHTGCLCTHTLVYIYIYHYRQDSRNKATLLNHC